MNWHLIFFYDVFCMTENESAFDLLYCITFKLMDQQWLNMRASYMDFNVCILQPEISFSDVENILSYKESCVDSVIDEQINGKPHDSIYGCPFVLLLNRNSLNHNY